MKGRTPVTEKDKLLDPAQEPGPTLFGNSYSTIPPSDNTSHKKQKKKNPGAKLTLQKWEVSGIRVYAKQESADRLFDSEQINELAGQRDDKRKGLASKGWPNFHDNDKTHWNTYSDYYRSELADTLVKFQYGKDLNCESTKYQACHVQDLARDVNVPLYSNEIINTAFSISDGDMLERAGELSRRGFSVCGFNPANNETVGGGAFVGAPNFEEDLFRVSNLGIALVQHAREKNDIHYEDKRPHYFKKQCLQENEALVTTNVRVIKRIRYPDGNHWYAKEFEDLPEDQQFSMSFVSNAAISLSHKRKFTADERAITTETIRAHLTAMIKAGTGVALLTDFGCGGFCNHPEEIATIYKTLLFDEGYARFFRGIEFTIKNPTNLAVFNTVFKDQPRSRVEDSPMLIPVQQPSFPTSTRTISISPAIIPLIPQSSPALKPMAPDKIQERDLNAVIRAIAVKKAKKEIREAKKNAILKGLFWGTVIGVVAVGLIIATVATCGAFAVVPGVTLAALAVAGGTYFTAGAIGVGIIGACATAGALTSVLSSGKDEIELTELYIGEEKAKRAKPKLSKIEPDEQSERPLRTLSCGNNKPNANNYSILTDSQKRIQPNQNDQTDQNKSTSCPDFTKFELKT